MKVINLSLKKPVIIALLGTGIFFYSCKGNKDSGENSTKSETDTTTMTKDTIVTGTGGQTVIKKTGKILVAAAPVNKTDKMMADKSGYYNYTDVAPLYTGGQGAIESYISNNIQYPDDALDNNVEGTVNVQFTIDENGKVGNVKAENSNLGHGLEEAAVKAVSQMPAWTPGKVKGKNVKAWYTLPVTFKIEG